jgi:uncharacterized membrane protein YbhN (UPF0104 family)
LAKLNRVRISLLAAWLGVALYFSAVVAPSAFGVLRSFSLANAGEIAGTIVSRSLSVVNKSGVLVSLLLLLGAPAVRKQYARASLVLQSILLFVVALACGVGEWVIAAKMRELRVAMHGQIDQVPLTDPNRTAFAALHGYSVAALCVAMLVALILILLMVFARERAGATPTT